MFLLAPNSGIPLYVQLQQQIRQRILSGQIENGTQLPSVRDLSTELHVNPLTVVKVYQILEREGFVESRRGMGTYVTLPSAVLPSSVRIRHISPAAEQLVAEAIHLGIGEKEIQLLLSDLFRKANRKTSQL